MRPHKVVSAAEQLEVRKAFLAKEKELTRLRDQLSQECRQLPWVKVDKEYLFDGPDGQETLADLFAARSQLIVYHFMYHPSLEEGCPSCSFWADNFNGIIVHLNHRDVSMVAISKAPLKQLEAYKKRMSWDFKWLSSYDDDFNRDYNVSFTAEELATIDLTNCELAVLSACETNVGIRRAGQGIQSLQTALHTAGARTAITSLWKVDDGATRRLFEVFYTKLWKEKLGVADALWQAKMALRGEGHALRDWAGWVLSGDPR